MFEGAQTNHRFTTTCIHRCITRGIWCSGLLEARVPVGKCNDSSCDVEGQSYTTESYQCTSLRADATYCLVCKLLRQQVKNLGLPKEKWVFWSDSLDVIYLVRGRSRQFKPFVSNRVREILTKTEPAQWVYTPTKANPANNLTRGTTADSLINDHVWWNGPEYLSQSEEMWPTMPLLATSSDEVERKHKYRLTFLASTKRDISMHKFKRKNTKLDPERFSDWFKFLRVIAYVVQFV